ncbi:hypothetical protein PG988_005447 [Apiospora saccharicola]
MPANRTRDLYMKFRCFWLYVAEPALPHVPPWKDIQVSTVLNLRHIAYVFLLTSSRAITKTIHLVRVRLPVAKRRRATPGQEFLPIWTHGACPHSPPRGRLECPITLQLDSKNRLNTPCFAAEHDIARTTARVEGESLDDCGAQDSNQVCA